VALAALAAGIYYVVRTLIDRVQLYYQDKAEKLYEQGQLASGAGNEAQAIENYTKALSYYFLSDFQRAKIYGMRGHSYLAQKAPLKAIQDFDIVLARRDLTNQSRADFLYDRAKTHFELNQNNEANNDLTAALTLTSDNPRYLYARGIVYISLGEFQLAINDFGQSIRCAPREERALRAGILLRKGVAYSGLGYPEASLRAYRAALKLISPNSAVEGVVRIQIANVQAWLRELREIATSSAA
jgi:tetratricopeptide (TPR) repeat protein